MEYPLPKPLEIGEHPLISSLLTADEYRELAIPRRYNASNDGTFKVLCSSFLKQLMELKNSLEVVCRRINYYLSPQVSLKKPLSYFLDSLAVVEQRNTTLALETTSSRLSAMFLKPFAFSLVLFHTIKLELLAQSFGHCSPYVSEAIHPIITITKVNLELNLIDFIIIPYTVVLWSFSKS